MSEFFNDGSGGSGLRREDIPLNERNKSPVRKRRLVTPVSPELMAAPYVTRATVAPIVTNTRPMSTPDDYDLSAIYNVPSETIVSVVPNSALSAVSNGNLVRPSSVVLTRLREPVIDISTHSSPKRVTRSTKQVVDIFGRYLCENKADFLNGRQDLKDLISPNDDSFVDNCVDIKIRQYERAPRSFDEPGPIADEYELEAIVGQFTRLGRGNFKRHFVVVFWAGYELPTVEPLANFKHKKDYQRFLDPISFRVAGSSAQDIPKAVPDPVGAGPHEMILRDLVMELQRLGLFTLHNGFDRYKFRFSLPVLQ
ncbi:uncharacterized protein LOC128960876 [Oppia nitens]|uniref:uncharacterized protein LOC128960876 n=1 Tax=Oppia nitens TaxID=1686743 RepID=UPI0023DCD9CF|nr:uncharacterized protein LOC128960876 [Oppia nitens]